MKMFGFLTFDLALQSPCRRPARRARFILLAAVGISALGPGRLAPPLAAAPPPMPTELEDPVEKFVPKRPRSAAEADRLEAQALFATARLYEQRQQAAKALQTYQRALRHDPDSIEILRRIVPLAFRLNRPAEAVRYAVRAVELAPTDVDLIRRLADHLVENGEPERAVKILETALASPELPEKSPVRPTIHARLGDLRHDAGEDARAVEHYDALERALGDPRAFGLDEEALAKLEPPGERLRERMAAAYLRVGKIDAAVRALAKVRPEDYRPGTHLVAAEAALRQGKADEAERAFGKALAGKSVGDDPRTWEVGAEIYAARGKANGVDSEFHALLERRFRAAPEKVAVALALARFETKHGRPAEAIEILHRSFAAGPSVEVLDELVRRRREAKNPAELLETLARGFEAPQGRGGGREILDRLGPDGKALSKAPELCKELLSAGERLKRDAPARLTYGVRMVLGVVAAENGDFPAAQGWFSSAVEAAEDDDRRLAALKDWSLALMTADRYDDAAVPLRKILDDRLVEPGDPTYCFHLAGCLSLAGKHDEALKFAKQGAAMIPDQPILARRVAWVLQRAGRIPEAVKEYERLIERFAGREGAKEARLALSAMYVTTKELTKAEEQLELVLDEYPDDPGACNDLGYLWADQGKHLERALRMVRIAVDSQPDNQAYRDSLGWTLHRLGRNEEALVELLKAAGDGDADGVILEHLGDVYERLGREAEAVAAWKQAAAKFEKSLPDEAERLEQVRAKLKTVR